MSAPREIRRMNEAQFRRARKLHFPPVRQL